MANAFIRLSLALAFTCAAWTSAIAAAPEPAPAPPLSVQTLTDARDKCRTAVATRFAATPTPNGAVQALLGMAGRNECDGVTVTPTKDPLPVLDAIGADLDKAASAYGCGPTPQTPVCAGLQAARTRRDELRSLQAGKVEKVRHIPKGTLTRFDAMAWRPQNASFGAGNQYGTSFMRLVLEASGADPTLVRRANPDVPYRELSADIGNANTECRPCEENVARVISLYAIFDALDKSFMIATNDNFDATVEHLDGLVGRWRAYHFGGGQGRAQLPWELAANSVIYDKFIRRDDVIWPEPPKGALILLHPSPGLAMKDVKGASMVVNAVEVLGGSFWSYSKTGSRKNEIGASLVAAYRARDDAKNWGYGVLVRTPLELSSLPINIVWTRTKLNAGGHDDTVALSVDISRYVPKLKNAACLFKLPSCEKGS